MKAEIITIGDEILIGQILDTNSAWIAAKLNEAGIRVASRLSVGDDVGAITKAVGEALQEADVTIITGGLGPTRDDITKKTLAEVFACGMKLHPPTYEAIGKMMAARGIEFNELNRSQAVLPESCEPLPNRNGTAPGMWFERGGRVVVALPGVPFEMKPLVEEQVLPRLAQRFSLKKITHMTLVTFGIAESMLAERLAPWEDSLPPHLRLAYLPSPGGIRLRLSAYETEKGAADEMREKFRELENMIPDYVLGYGDDTNVEKVVAGMLTARGATLAVAESCTGGRIASRFTAMPGASQYLLSGVVSYSNRAKTEILGVDPSAIAEHGAVSREVAIQMAEGARRISGADYAIATTGVAGPTGGSAEKPVGTVWIAVASPGATRAEKRQLGRQREQNIERASSVAIDMLRQVLRG